MLFTKMEAYSTWEKLFDKLKFKLNSQLKLLRNASQWDHLLAETFMSAYSLIGKMQMNALLMQSSKGLAHA